MRKIVLFAIFLLPFSVYPCFERDYAKAQVNILIKAIRGEDFYDQNQPKNRLEVIQAIKFVLKHHATLKESGLLKKFEKELKKAAITEKLLQDPLINQQLKKEIAGKIQACGAIIALAVTSWAIVDYLLTKEMNLNTFLVCALVKLVAVESTILGAISFIVNLGTYYSVDETQQAKLDDVQSILAAFSSLGKTK